MFIFILSHLFAYLNILDSLMARRTLIGQSKYQLSLMTMCVRKLQIIECFYRFKRIQCKVQLILNKTILELVIDYVKTINKLIICVIANLLCLSIINLLHFIFILCNPVLLKGKKIYLLLYNIIKKVLSRHSQVFKLKIIFTFSSKT